MTHLSHETVGEIISGDMFANLNIVEMALIRKALKSLYNAVGTLKLPHYHPSWRLRRSGERTKNWHVYQVSR